MFDLSAKRVFDIIAASTGLVLLSPIFLVSACLLSYYNRGTPFFFQNRPGKDEKIFRIIKFKTMNDRVDATGELLPSDQRITPIGRLIRKLSIDEIPQLINVVKGDMSIVGPRPLLVKYLPLYSDFQKRRHTVNPGITGWAQVNGRNSISWDEKFKLDVWYVENKSMLIDLKIIFLTIKKVIVREGVNSSENLNMPTFTGNN